MKNSLKTRKHLTPLFAVSKSSERHLKIYPVPLKQNTPSSLGKKLQGCETSSFTHILAWTLKQFGKQSNIISQGSNRQFKKSKMIKNNTYWKTKEEPYFNSKRRRLKKFNFFFQLTGCFILKTLVFCRFSQLFVFS